MTGLIARGGMSAVYAAQDERLERAVAVKVLDANLAEDPAFVRRFQREAKAAARLSDPHVVAVFDEGEDDGLLFLVMELVPGRTLRSVIDAGGPMPAGEALALLDQILAALTAAHGAGLVHRDVKPENVLITPGGLAKVTDFGLARALADPQASGGGAGTFMGTAAYLAPEQAQSGSGDERSDVYSAGVLLFELVTGELPFTADTAYAMADRHVRESVPAPSSIEPSVPASVDSLVATATNKHPEDRYPDAASFATAVHGVQRTLGPVPVPGPGPGPGSAERASTADPDPGEAATEVVSPSTPPAIATEVIATASPAALPPADLAPVAPSPTRRAPVDRPGIEPARRGGRAIVVAVILVLAGVVGGLAWWFGTDEMVTVPDVSGQSIEQAGATLSSYGLTVQSGEQVFDELVPTGQIVTTDPPRGQRVVRGSALTAAISKGPAPIEIPSVIGQSTTDARKALEQAGFAVEVKKQFGFVMLDRVIAQSPGGGGTLPKGSTVTITIT